MSFSLNTLSGALEALASWRNNLQPASFRGVPFYVDEAAGSGGRRKIVHQFPLRDDPFIQDLGRAANRFRLTAFVVGDTYLQDSRDLLSALQDYDDSAILVHPWRGQFTCHAGLVTYREHKNLGGCCSFEIEFVVDTGAPASPTTAIDTVSQLLAGLAGLGSLAIEAYETASLIAEYPALLIGFAGGLLGNLASGLLGLPGGVIAGLATAIQAVALAPSNDSATASAVWSVFQGCATNAVTYLTPADQVDDPVMGLAPAIAAQSDRTAGLGALAAWGDSLVTPVNATQATQQQVVQSLAQGAAVAAVLSVYAQIAWPNAQAASAARDQVVALVDSQLALTAALGQDDLYRAWQAIGSLAVQDLIQRAQALPALLTWRANAARPSLVLAYQWYQDAGRSDELEDLNAAPDPMFMPYSGVRLSA